MQRTVIKMQPDLRPEKDGILYNFFPLSQDPPAVHDASAALQRGEA